MDWIQVFTIIGVLGGVIAIQVSFTLWHATKIDNEMREARQRTDQLYQMFVDLLKDRK